MKKPIYQPLTDFLLQQSYSIVSFSFSELEEVLGRKLPPTAYKNPAWWTNNPTGHSQAKAWLAASFHAEPVVTDSKTVVFKRLVRSQSRGGMSEAAREFGQAKDAGGKKQNRHPALGAMKGMFWVDPTWDLTKPTMSDEELADMEANIHRTADMVEAGASGGSEAAREYQEQEPEKKRGRHPAFGALKGTFWIDPEWDLTKPTMSEEELDEMEANLHRTADLIDAGFGKKQQ
jgi:hypothetical protein